MPLAGTASTIAGGGVASMYKSLSDRTRAAQAKRNDIGLNLAPNQAIPITSAMTSGGTFDLSPYVGTLMVNVPAGGDYMFLQAGGFYQSGTGTGNYFNYEFYFLSSPPYSYAQGDTGFFQIPSTAAPYIQVNSLEGMQGVIYGLIPGWYELSLFAGVGAAGSTGTLLNAWFMAWAPPEPANTPTNQFILGSATEGILGTNVLG